MMVARSPYVENVGLLMKDLDQATTKLTAISKKEKVASPNELNDIIKVLNKVNENLDTSFWEAKKLAPEGMTASIEKALQAVQLFHRIRPELTRAAQLTAGQAIASLKDALDRAVDGFDRNIKNLKKIKLGQKVVKPGETKNA
jgi:hypothetical protein